MSNQAVLMESPLSAWIDASGSAIIKMLATTFRIDVKINRESNPTVMLPINDKGLKVLLLNVFAKFLARFWYIFYTVKTLVGTAVR